MICFEQIWEKQREKLMQLKLSTMFSYFFDFQCGVFVLLTNVMRAKVKKILQTETFGGKKMCFIPPYTFS